MAIGLQQVCSPLEPCGKAAEAATVMLSSVGTQLKLGVNERGRGGEWIELGAVQDGMGFPWRCAPDYGREAYNT